MRGSSSNGREASLKQRTVSSTAVVSLSFALATIIRLGSNLILTRLLVPDMFGVMVLVQAVAVGLNLFSDMGIGQNIINHKRGAEPVFMNTVWTTNIIRSLILWLVILVFAYPMAIFWKSPGMAPMIAVVGFSYVIMSFESTGMWLLCREVKNFRIEVCNIITQIVSTGLLIGVAFYWRSVWVLVISTLINAICRVGMSYLMLPGHRCWFAWEKEAIHDIIKFGKWIFISSGVMFVLGYADKVILGRMITKEELGIYSIAFALAAMGVQAINRLANNTLFPVYSRLAEKGTDELRHNTMLIRGGIMGMSLPFVWFIGIYGDKIIHIMYDARYVDAGWMLRLMAIGSVGMVVNQTATSVLLAKRDSKRYMIMQSTRASIYIVGLLIGGYYGGLSGLIVGMIIAQLSEYPVVIWAIRPHKVWLPALDFSVLALSGVVIGLGRTFLN
ncbi:oligosaccharide flippase family protein [Planctomycetota bacterium]|nr:oligosaccharide flippase family protein [Planctomycetota bacterium]